MFFLKKEENTPAGLFVVEILETLLLLTLLAALLAPCPRAHAARRRAFGRMLTMAPVLRVDFALNKKSSCVEVNDGVIQCRIMDNVNQRLIYPRATHLAFILLRNAIGPIVIRFVGVNALLALKA